MIYVMIAVKDNAIQAFQPPSFVRAKGEGIRAFTDAVNNPDNRQLHQHPEDFDLYTIGTWDDDNAKVSEPKVELLVRGKDVLQPRQ